MGVPIDREEARYSMDRRHFLTLSATGVAAAAAPRAAFAQPRALTLGTASTSGTYFIYGGVVATLLTKAVVEKNGQKPFPLP